VTKKRRGERGHRGVNMFTTVGGGEDRDEVMRRGEKREKSLILPCQSTQKLAAERGEEAVSQIY